MRLESVKVYECINGCMLGCALGCMLGCIKEYMLGLMSLWFWSVCCSYKIYNVVRVCIVMLCMSVYVKLFT